MKFGKLQKILPVMTLLLSLNAFSQDLTREMMDKIIEPDNVGNEFWLTMPPAYYIDGSMNVVNIFVFSEYKGWARLQIPGIGVFKQKFFEPYQVISLSVHPDSIQPYSPDRLQMPLSEFTFYTKAAQVTSNVPVTVYVVGKYESSGEGYLAMPARTLGTEYIAACYAGSEYDSEDGTVYYPGSILIVSPYDSTELKFILPDRDNARTAGGYGPGDTIKASLNKADIFLVSSLGNGSDISGSMIISNNPVAVFGSHPSGRVPVKNAPENYMVEMIPPVNTWGKNFAVPVAPERETSPVIRIYTREKTYTNLTDTIEAGMTEFYLNDPDDDKVPRFLTSDKPVMVSFFNPGYMQGLPAEPNKDPFFMIIPPLEQYKKEYFFALPSSGYHDIYEKNYLLLNFLPEEEGNIPDHLKIGLVKDKQIKTQFLSYYFQVSEAVSVKDTISDFASQIFELPETGFFKIEDINPSCAFLQGYQLNMGYYGFPAAMNIRSIRSIDTLAPVSEWTSDDVGNISGFFTDLPEDPSVRTNLASVWFLEDESYNCLCELEDVKVPGVDSILGFDCEALNLDEDARAAFLVSDKNGNSNIVYAYYYTVSYEFKPEIINFGTVKIGDSAKAEFEIFNTSKKEIFVKDIEINDKEEYFTVEYDGKPFELESEKGKKFNIIFHAKKTGQYNTSLVPEVDKAAADYKLLLSAAVKQPYINVSSISYGTVDIGKSVKKQATIINPGEVPLSITGFEMPSSTVFSVHLPENISPENPLNIAPGCVYSLNITFIPDDDVSYSDSLVVISDASEQNNVIKLTGRGRLTSGIAEYKRAEINIFPNPAEEFVYITYDSDAAIKEIHLLNLLGEILDTKIQVEHYSGAAKLNIKKLSPGIYFLRIKLGNDFYSKKFTISR